MRMMDVEFVMQDNEKGMFHFLSFKLYLHTLSINISTI